MSDRIFYIHSNLSCVPWEGSTAAVTPTSPPTPVHYHVLYRGCGETQVSWHGETYCLVGGYRTYGDAPLATPAKVEAEKPIPSQAPKRRRALTESDEDLGCSSPKIRRSQRGARKLTPQKLAGGATLQGGKHLTA
uniref:DPEP2 neighbor protein-like n=1 Tax=Ailuropoda melanoleuca TaxID=9646 RepID=A0A7N5P2U4_AILME